MLSLQYCFRWTTLFCTSSLGFPVHGRHYRCTSEHLSFPNTGFKSILYYVLLLSLTFCQCCIESQRLCKTRLYDVGQPSSPGVVRSPVSLLFLWWPDGRRYELLSWSDGMLVQASQLWPVRHTACAVFCMLIHLECSTM